MIYRSLLLGLAGGVELYSAMVDMSLLPPYVTVAGTSTSSMSEKVFTIRNLHSDDLVAHPRVVDLPRDQDMDYASLSISPDGPIIIPHGSEHQLTVVCDFTTGLDTQADVIIDLVTDVNVSGTECIEPVIIRVTCQGVPQLNIDPIVAIGHLGEKIVIPTTYEELASDNGSWYIVTVVPKYEGWHTYEVEEIDTNLLKLDVDRNACTELEFTMFDDGYASHPITDFEFPLFETVIQDRKVRVSTNGNVCVGQCTSADWKPELPSQSFTGVLAPLWMDLITNTESRGVICESTEYLYVLFQEFSFYYDREKSVTFSTLVQPNGVISFGYDDHDKSGLIAHVGVSDVDGTRYAPSSYQKEISEMKNRTLKFVGAEENIRVLGHTARFVDGPISLELEITIEASETRTMEVVTYASDGTEKKFVIPIEIIVL